MRRDGFEWALWVAQVFSAIVGAVAIILAVRATRRARTAEARSRDALVRERRIDFQLDLLKELSELNLHGENVSGVQRRHALIASLLPADLVPLARAVVNLETTPERLAYVRARWLEWEADATPKIVKRNRRALLADEIREEARLAVERLLAERHEGDVESHRGRRWRRLRLRIGREARG